MLSTQVFSSSDAATKYYSQGDYYGAESQGVWLGSGAKELDLTGAFDSKVDQSFVNILKGIMPNGQILSKKTKDGMVHCPGVDLTFSAPKSFSIQMFVYAKKEEKQLLEKALMTSVTNTLKFIEENDYVVARKGHGGEIKEAINKLIFASFIHSTNRNLEPQAHVHCLLANAAKCQDGSYRSISFDKILKHNKFFGQVFRNELAVETKKLGYEITPTILSDGSSSFELTKIDHKLIEAFSTRRKEIEELCKLYNITSKEGRDKIVITSRKHKQLVTSEELSNAWNLLEQKITIETEQDKLNSTNLISEDQKIDKKSSNSSISSSSSAFTKALNFISENFSFSLSKRRSRNKINVDVNEASQSQGTLSLSPFKLKDLANLCIEDISHHNSVFSKEDLYKKTLKFAIGNFCIKEIVSEHQTQEQNGLLIRHNDQFTSKALLDLEKKILEYAKTSIGSAKPIIEEKYFAAHFDKFCTRESKKNPNFKINEQQQQVVKHILASKDKIVTIIGLPGVGKSTALNAVRDIADHKLGKIISLGLLGENFTGLAPTASAAKTLSLSAKVESNTIHSFLSKHQGYIEGRGKNSLSEQRKTFKNTIIFVDEASLIPTHIMHKLLTLREIFGFRIVLSGDIKQLPAVEAGKPFEQMIQIIAPIALDVIVRQEDESHKKAIISASLGKIQESFAIHAKNIQVKKNLSSETANSYLQSNQHRRADTILISPTRALRDNINNNIRKGLQLENSLTEEVKEFIVLRQKDMTIADYQFAYFFKINDILKFHKSYKNNNNVIEKDEYLRVKSINAISNNLLLVKENGKEVMFALRKEVDYQSKFEVYQTLNLQLQEGLKIVFTKNNRNYGLINSETAIIKTIDQKYMNLQFENKLVRKIPLSELKNIDYGYCTTVHSSQGKTFDYTKAAINIHPLLNDQKSWLVTLSRHRKDITIFIENQQELEKNLSHNDGNQMSAIELQALINLDTKSQASDSTNILGSSKQKHEFQPDTQYKNSDDKNVEFKINTYNYKEYDSPKYSSRDIHDKLANNLNALAKQLLPNLSQKKIITNKNSIQCGSINIITTGSKRGLWTRFSTDQKGNLFDLIKESQGLGCTKAAVEWSKDYLGVYDPSNALANDHFIQNSDNKLRPLNLDDSRIQKLIPTPQNATKFTPERTFYYLLKESSNSIEAVYQYRNIKNELCGYVVRIKDSKLNKKQTLPVIYAQDSNGKRGWIIKGFDDNRCLYNEHKLANNSKPVLIVEGEKAADSASRAYPELTVVSWCGGANGYRKSDWSVLQAKEVVIWPDNDKAGFMAANGIKEILERETVKVKACKIIDLTKLPNLPEKWDLADNLPNSVQRHQISGLLLSVAKIDDNIRIYRTVMEYTQYRQEQILQDMKNTKFSDLSERYAMQYKYDTYIKHEAKLAREKLNNTPFLSESDQAQIISDTKIEAHNNNVESEAKSFAARELWFDKTVQHTDKLTNHTASKQSNREIDIGV